MSTEDAFLDTLYQSPSHPELWGKALEMLTDMVGGSMAWLSVLNVVDGDGQGLWTRIDPRFVDQFFAYFAARNPLNLVRNAGRFFNDWRPAILTDQDWMPKAELRRTEYYNDFLLPVEAASCVMIRLAKHEEEASASVVNITRGAGKPPFEAAELERLRALHPHLIRALKLSETVARAGLQARTSGGCTADQAVLSLDGEGRLVGATSAAEALLRRGDALDVCGGRLVAHDPVAAPRLEALIRAACARPPQPRLGGRLALRRPEGRAPYVVSVAPHGDGGDGAFLRDRFTLVIVADPDNIAKPAAETLRDLFGLTRAESRLALALLDGGALREVADRLGISANTARIHLARVFEKTGVNRQAALAVLIGCVAAPPAKFQRV